MDVDEAPQKLDFNEYSETPKKKPRTQPKQPESTHLEVFLRIRPTSKISSTEYTLSNENKSIRLSSPNQSDIRNYTFDHIFDQNTNNTQVFNKIGAIAIDRFLNGFSNLIFSYGITGSGKTHTIMGSNNKLDGLIPLILTQLFNNNKNGKYNIFASYLENYNKEIYDLLVDNSESKPLNIRVLPTGVDIPDLRTMEITNTNQALELIEFGNNKRRQAHTKLNTHSSRSHALFILDLFDNDNNKLISQLCIVDLAGSESSKRTGFHPNDQRFVESCEINSSLSVLSRCIEGIKDGNNSVPWREVILTKILYQYLTGNGYVNMIVNAHINNDDYNETIRAIEFGSNSQNIRMNPIVNSVRMSTRHKSRICNNNNSVGNFGVNINHINFLNTLTNIKQLQSIAIASYKTLFKMQYIIFKLKDDKISQIDKFIKFKENERKIQSIQEEENESDNDCDNDKYKELSEQMAQKEMALSEKMAEINHLYGELSSKNEIIETYKNKLLDRDVKINKYAIDFNESKNEIEKYKTECNKYKQLINNMNNEKENELNILNNKLQSNVNRYKIVMDENDQKIETLTHKIRDFKEKLQTKCIEISEKDEQLIKLKNEINKLKSEYNKKSNVFDKNINTFKKINDDAQQEIINLNKSNIEKDNKYKNIINKLDELNNIISEKDHEINVLNKYNLDINKQMDIKNEIIKIKDNKIEELVNNSGNNTENKQLLSELNVKLNKSKMELINKIKEMENVKQKMINNDKEYENKINGLMGKMDVKNEEIENLKKCNGELKDEMNGKYKEYKNKLDGMVNGLKDKQNEMERLNKFNDELHDKMSKLNNEMIGKNSKWKMECDEMNKCINQNKDQIIGLKKDKNDMEKELIEKDGLISNLRQYKLDKDKEIKDKNNEFNNMKNEINKLKNIINNEKIKNDKIVNDLNNKKNENDKYQIEMDTQIAIKNEQIDKLKNELKNEKEMNDKTIYNLNNEIKEMNDKLKNEMSELNVKKDELCEVKNEIEDIKSKLNDITNKKHQIMRELNNIINDKNQLIQNEKYISNEKNELMIKLSNAMSEKNILISKLNDITKETNEKLNEENNLKIKYNNLEIKYNNQSSKLISLSENINQLNNELNINKVNINKQIKDIKNELINEFNNKITNEIEINKHKDAIISEWKRKCSEYDMINLELKDKYERLENQLNKEKEWNKISLSEADQQYNLAQTEIIRLNALNDELEQQKNEKIELEKQLNVLQQQLNDLRLKSLPIHSAPHSAHSNVSNTSNISNKISRKRQRQEMENDVNNNDNNITNPNKKRKITIENGNNNENNDININVNNDNDNNDISIRDIHDNTDDDDNDIIITNNDSENENDISNNNSLEPRQLINELIPIAITPPNNNNNKINIKNNIKLSKIKENAASIITPSPVPSHLSEGDPPLPKMNKLSRLSIGTIKQKQKQYKLIRTPAHKQSKSRTKSDITNQTPITKTGLRKLRCVDLKQKLKKHSLKPKGKKEDFVLTLFNHKNKENNNNYSSESDEDIDYEWIGKYIKKCDDKIYYSGIKVNGLNFNIGSECYINTERGETWMSKIVELFEDEDGDVFMGNMWYWKYNEIIKAVKNSHIIQSNDNKNEVFISCGHEPDINNIAFMVTKKIFKVFDDKNEMDLYKKNNKNNKRKIDLYYLRYSFNTKTKTLIQNENNSDNDENNKENINKNNKNVNKNKRPRARNRRKKKTT